MGLISSLADIRDGQNIAFDPTWVRAYQSGEWICERHKKKKPFLILRIFLRLHVTVNVKTKQTTASITIADNVGDGEMTQRVGDIKINQNIFKEGAFPWY